MNPDRRIFVTEKWGALNISYAYGEYIGCVPGYLLVSFTAL